MNLRVYLPDRLGAWAKQRGLNLSGLLRAEVERRYREEEGATEIEPGVYRLEDALLIDVDPAADVELAEGRVRIPLDALRRWLDAD